MKAAVCHAFGTPLVIEEVEIDPPKGSEVKVRVAACAICQSDIHFMEGAWGGELPAVYGHEAAGVVEVAGPEVQGLAPGDHVVVTLLRSCGHCFYCARGEPNMCETRFPLDEEGPLRFTDGRPIKQGLRTAAFAEHVVVESSQVAPIPAELPLDSAALLACGVITGLGAVVNTAKVPAGSSVAVIGTGGVGLNSIQGAALSGAHPVIAIDLADSKLAAARDFGATDGVNAASKDLVEAVRSLTHGRGADYVFVTVGSVKAIEQGLELLRRSGVLVIVGMPPNGAKAEIEAVDFADRNLRVLGSKMGSTRLPVDVPRLVESYREGRLKLDELITGRFRLEEINEAIASVKRGEALRNVILF